MLKISKEKILEIAAKNERIKSIELSKKFLITRQYASLMLNELVDEGRLVKIGSTHSAFYVLPEYAQKTKDIFPKAYTRTYKNISLEEHRVLEQIEDEYQLLKKLPENIRNIFTYAFSEMFNNAIEHSGSDTIRIEVAIQKNELSFTVHDTGVGVFRNIKRKKGLDSEIEAIQDLLKGKTTTMPKSHSGEGIFFTSKAGDLFILDSYGCQLIADNRLPDIFVNTEAKNIQGTRVSFMIHTDDKRHLNDLFKRFTSDINDEFGFDKTEVRIKLYTLGGVHISRSQARRVLSGLEKFKVIVFDFDKVPMIGQAFADEIFRVFHRKYPKIKLETENMNEGVRFMVKRAINENNI